ncbi:MAG: multicopper oxidase, partial [Pseudomonadota bacterium]
MSLTLSRRQFISGSAALLAASSLRPAWSNTDRPTLPIPALIDGTNGEPIDLQIRTGTWSFMPGVTTPTLGISQ